MRDVRVLVQAYSAGTRDARATERVILAMLADHADDRRAASARRVARELGIGYWQVSRIWRRYKRAMSVLSERIDDAE
jgi:DNA invertase Pin-like site-specific DNA recombinase